MADISALVNYQQAHPVELQFRGEPVGITMNVISFDSEPVVAADALVSNKRMMAIYAAEDKTPNPEMIAEFDSERERARCVAAIQSWEFNGNSFGDLGVDPECNDANKRYLVGHPNAKWIRDQITMAGVNLQNFTQALPTPYVKKSPKK